jgi:hypothetical protein
MSKRNIHTVYNGNRGMWETKKEKQDTPLYSSHTKQTAIEKSIREAKKLEVEHVIHNKSGKISDKDSYGHDPVPPEDKKY